MKDILKENGALVLAEGESFFNCARGSRGLVGEAVTIETIQQA